jgi:hypothetical protein
MSHTMSRSAATGGASSWTAMPIEAVYLKLLHEKMDLYGVALIEYCLMSNHVHLDRYTYEG